MDEIDNWWNLDLGFAVCLFVLLVGLVILSANKSVVLNKLWSSPQLSACPLEETSNGKR